MEPRTLQFIAQATGGELLGGRPEAVVQRVCTDSRQLVEGDLFVALRGERFDGHRFLAEAGRKLAAAALVDRAEFRGGGGNLPLIAVPNARLALGRLAERYRRDFALPLIAVGGSNGKSTTKELIASVLRQRFPTLWSEASYNNDIGVPLTLLRLERCHEAAVLEVGTNHPGELAPLLAMIRPRFGVLTSIGPEHLEFFGDLEGVLKEEGTLVESVEESGRVFVNLSSGPAQRLCGRGRAPWVRIGWSADYDWSVSGLELDERGSTFEVKAPQMEFCGRYRLNLLGRHQVLNALLAAATGAALGLQPHQVRRGLADCQPLKMRLQPWEVGGVRVLDDCYNANLESMIAALQTLGDLPCTGRRIAVLGEMAELGAHSPAAHVEVGRCAARSGLSRLLTVGRLSRLTADAAREAGLRHVQAFLSVAAARRALSNLVTPGDVVLLKASRAAGLDRLAFALRQPYARTDKPSGLAPAEAANRKVKRATRAWATEKPRKAGRKS